MRLASGSDWLGKLTPPKLGWGTHEHSALCFAHAGDIFENVGVMLGRAVLEAPEPFCEVLDPLIGGGS